MIRTELRRQIPEPVGRIQDVHRRPVFFLTQVADDLRRLDLGEIVGKSGKRAVRAVVRQLALDQVRQLILFTECEIDLGAILGADVVQTDVLSLCVLPEMRVLEQHRGDGVLEAHALIATHQSGIEEIDFRRLQNGAGDVAVPGLDGENDIERLQDVQIALQRVGRNREIAGNGSQRERRANAFAQKFDEQPHGGDFVQA